jgi:hypothetical protein
MQIKQRKQRSQIAVIGGGLTGCLIALDLAENGHEVTIFEKEVELVRRASIANEAKIHLGYVYSSDQSFRTAQTMIDDALRFRPLLERWIGAATFETLLTAPFHYVVPEDSRLPASQIKQHFNDVHTYLAAQEAKLGLRYLGGSEASQTVIENGREWIGSRERGIWPQGIADAIADEVRSHPRIMLRLGCTVDHMDAAAERWFVMLDGPQREKAGPFDIVANVAWSGRRQIDRKSGFGPKDSFFTRYKFGVILENASKVLGDEVPKNTTATTGPYGDSVYYPVSDSLYCSWYPVGMCFSSTDDDISFTPPTPDTHAALIRDTWQGYATIDPDYGALLDLPEPISARLIGDFIVATGRSDIIDPTSLLHERWVHGPRKLGDGYWSVDTGKYTSAPRCAAQCVDAILDRESPWPD